MVFVTLDSLEVVNALVKVCEKYKDIDTDVLHGRYIVNGRSVLGVSSLLTRQDVVQTLTILRRHI